MTSPASTPGQGPSIGRASFALASGTVVSRVLGFVKAAVLAATLGVVGSASGDAFAVANQLPNTVYAIVAGGVLSAVLVPQIVRAALHADGGRGYINKLLTIAMVLLGVATAVTILVAPWLVQLYGPDFTSDQLALATVFAYWCLPQIFFYGLYTLLGEVLNAKSMFGPFTWAPVLNNLVAIAGLIAFIVLFGAGSGNRPVTDWSSSMISILAGSATLGVAAQAFVLLYFWRRIGISYRPDFRWRGVGLGATGKIAGWAFGMLLLTTLAGVVESRVASAASGEAASIFALQTAWLVFMLPHSVFTVSIATAYFTRMSEHVTRGDDQALKSDVSASIRGISAIIVFATAGLIVVAYPFSSLFAQDFVGTQALGNVIIAFLIGLPAFCVLFVLQRTFYALGDTRTPFFFTLFQVVLFSVGAFLCLFLPVQLLAIGIALTMSISGTLQTLLAAILLRRRLRHIDGFRIVRSLTRFVVAAIPAMIIGFTLVWLLGGLRNGGFAVTGVLGAGLSMMLVGVAMTACYVGMLHLMRVSELHDALGPLKRRFGRVGP